MKRTMFGVLIAIIFAGLMPLCEATDNYGGVTSETGYTNNYAQREKSFSSTLFTVDDDDNRNSGNDQKPGPMLKGPHGGGLHLPGNYNDPMGPGGNGGHGGSGGNGHYIGLSEMMLGNGFDITRENAWREIQATRERYLSAKSNAAYAQRLAEERARLVALQSKPHVVTARSAPVQINN
jgi:hypothetical protein